MSQNISQLPQFTTPSAKKLWLDIPENIRSQLLANVYCGQCKGETTIVNYTGSLKSGLVVLSGQCKTCGADVARVID